MAESTSKTVKTSRKKPSRLGRGLSSLMAQSVPVEVELSESAGSDLPPLVAETPSREPAARSDSNELARTSASDPATVQPASGAELQYIPLGDIHRNEDQPRQHFDAAALETLASSIATAGLMQPIIVRPLEASQGQYQIVAGERRWRAAQQVNLKTIPAIVRTLDDQQTAEWALIENLQREDLNPIERARAFERLHDQFELDHAEIAHRVGLERSTVTNLLRLLSLSPTCQQHVQDGLLAMGHARAIAALGPPDLQDQLADKTIREGLSVRKVEQLVKSFQETGQKPNINDDGSTSAGGVSAAGAANKVVRSAYLADLEEQLGDQLKTRVRIRPGRKKHSGTLQIDFFTLEQFDDLVKKLGIEATES